MIIKFMYDNTYKVQFRTTETVDYILYSPYIHILGTNIFHYGEMNNNTHQPIIIRSVFQLSSVKVAQEVHNIIFVI